MRFCLRWFGAGVFFGLGLAVAFGVVGGIAILARRGG